MRLLGHVTSLVTLLPKSQPAPRGLTAHVSTSSGSDHTRSADDKSTGHTNSTTVSPPAHATSTCRSPLSVDTAPSTQCSGGCKLHPNQARKRETQLPSFPRLTALPQILSLDFKGPTYGKGSVEGTQVQGERNNGDAPKY